MTPINDNSRIRAELARLMKSRLWANVYSQSRPCHFWGMPEGVNPGRADCGGSCRAVYLRALGFDIGGNTSAQVDDAKRGKHGARIVQTPKGTRFDESSLLLGDLLCFRGNPAHTDGVGHVEMYAGKNECLGHGGGHGPTAKRLDAYCDGRAGNRRALYAVRFVHDDELQHPSSESLGDTPLVYGMKHPHVGELQRRLLRLNYNLGAFGPAKDGVDGDYGPLTRAAVIAEQRLAGTAPTGDADIATIRFIVARANGDALLPKPAQRVLVTGDRVHLRVGAGSDSPILRTVRAGDAFPASGEMTGDWIGLIDDGKAAWIHSKYATVEGAPDDGDG